MYDLGDPNWEASTLSTLREKAAGSGFILKAYYCDVDLQDPYSGPLSDEERLLKEEEKDLIVEASVKEIEKKKVEPMPQEMEEALDRFRRRHKFMTTYDGFTEMLTQATCFERVADLPAAYNPSKAFWYDQTETV